MSLTVIDSDAFHHMEKVVERHLKGHSPLKIARDLGIKVVEVNKNVEQWREIVGKDMESRDAARDHLNEMVQRYNLLISRLNKNLKELEQLDFDEKVSAQINTTVKNIGDLDKSRVDLLQKAGLLENHALGDELAEREMREEALINILRNDLCPDCKMTVARKLQALTNEVEVVQVFDE